MKRLTIPVAVMLALSACATGSRLSDDQRLAIYRAHAGEPVSSFHYFSTLQSWAPLGDSALTVWVRPQTGYLLTLAGSCPDLAFAHAIRLTGQNGAVFSGLDKVEVLDRQAIDIPCRISRIQPLDAKAVRAGRA